MKIVVLCDLHFGPSKNNENIYNSLSQVVYPYILNNPIDLIVICGDDTDDRISLDQIASRYWLQFWKDITSFKKPDGTPIPVRGLSGTESHQRNQLQALQFWVKDTDVNVKLYETSGIENFNGLNFLYIPEESVYDKYEFYKNTLYSGTPIDMVFGHGMFDFIGNSDDIVVSQGKSICGEWEYVFSDYIEDIVDMCENLRLKFKETDDTTYWKALIQILPNAFLQTRTVTMSYANLRNIYFQRKNHKLSEWHDFCDWIKTLPYSEELLVLDKNNG